MRLQKRKVDSYEWRCRNQSKDNHHDVVRSFTFGRVSACIAFFYCVENVKFYAFRPRFADSINFLLPSEKNAAESHQMLVEAYGSNALSRAQCNRWFEKFQNGDFDVRNEERGRPAKKFEDAELQALLDEDYG
ncbi:mariner Mos1 transposase [Trichonephila clavipes]|nr:mariner Mos1 transposase [Trichonephila clavipes]